MARVKIKELRLRNFRAFENACLELDDKLTVIVGRNGSGKSTLMDAFEFMHDALLEGLVTALIKHGGMSGISHKQPGSLPSDISIAIELSVDGQDVVYGFSVGISPSSLPASMRGFYNFWVTKETLVSSSGTGFFTRNGDQFDTDITSIAPTLAQEALLLPQIASATRLWEEILEALRQIHVYKLSPTVMSEEQEPSGVSWLTSSGSNAAEVLSKIAFKQLTGQSQDIRWIVEHLNAITKGVIGIGPIASPTGKTSVEFVQSYDGTQNNFTAAQMSDGTLRSLGILLALRQEPTPTLVFFDEIEDSIDPGALGVILDAISASTDRMQVVISSHNTDLLDRKMIRAESTRVVEWQEGVSSIHQLSEQVIKAIDGPYVGVLKRGEVPYSVGELLRVNALRINEASIAVAGDFFGV